MCLRVMFCVIPNLFVIFADAAQLTGEIYVAMGLTSALYSVIMAGKEMHLCLR